MGLIQITVAQFDITGCTKQWRGEERIGTLEVIFGIHPESIAALSGLADFKQNRYFFCECHKGPVKEFIASAAMSLKSKEDLNFDRAYGCYFTAWDYTGEENQLFRDIQFSQKVLETFHKYFVVSVLSSNSFLSVVNKPLISL